LEIGGAETQLVRLINRLDRNRFQPSLICLFGYGPLKSQLDDRVELVSPRLPSLNRSKGLGRAAALVRGLGELRSELRRQRPDIVHGYLMTAYALGALASWPPGDRLVIASRRGSDTYCINPSRRLRLVARMASPMIDYHLCNSEAVRRMAIADEALPSSRTGVIYNGIDLPTDDGEAQLPKEWRLGDADGRAAMVANFIGYKRHVDVIAAVKVVVKRRPNFRLVLFGDGTERGSIEHLLRDQHLEENVVLAGARADAATLLSGFDFTVLASSEESFPNALMESMARAVPVVATSVGGVPELVRDGIDGRLVQFGHPEELAGAMLDMLDKPQMRSQMGHAARNRIRDSFSVESMTSQTQDLYLELLARAGSR
jgi:glycosyltransferase involved in cell wall biosynthesis